MGSPSLAAADLFGVSGLVAVITGGGTGKLLPARNAATQKVECLVPNA